MNLIALLANSHLTEISEIQTIWLAYEMNYYDGLVYNEEKDQCVYASESKC
jgi:hypothetical protein